MSASVLPDTLAHLSPRVASVVAEAKAGLEALYGDHLARVVLHGDVRPYDEIRRTSELSYSFLLDRETIMSMQAYMVKAYETQQNSFMQNVRREGVIL